MFIKTVIILNLFLFHLINCSKTNRIEDEKFWRTMGEKHLIKTLKINDNFNMKHLNEIKAKNLIILIGDGMGMTTITAGRIFKGQLKGNNGEEENLSFDEFPNIGLAKTYNVDKQVPDSAGTATAIFSGVKTRYGVIGMDSQATKTNSNIGKLSTIMSWAQKQNKMTGFITTTRISHATPAALYSNVYDRDWECDTEIPDDLKNIYKDISVQLIENEPGNKFNIIFGGGLSTFGIPNLNQTPSKYNYDGSTEIVCERSDERNLIDEWLNLNGKINKRKFIKTRTELLNLNLTENYTNIMGLFRNNHLTYSIDRTEEEPSLLEMTATALEYFEMNKNHKNGYVLMIESGRIDQAHHQNYARIAMNELIEFDRTIDLIRNTVDINETLIIVTADHSHALTLNGYPKRGNNILGYANKNSKIERYETLMYANGPGYWSHRLNSTDFLNTPNRTWLNLTEIDNNEREQPIYRNLATLPLNDETHGGEDVPVYSIGPGSQLIRGVFEQNYLAYVISYSMCIGPVAYLNDLCIRNYNNTNDYYPVKNHSNTIKKYDFYLFIYILIIIFSFY